MQHAVLKRCVDGLKTLRSSKHRTLDASVIAELDAVIFQLERCLDTANEIEIDRDLKMRVLKVISNCVELATNLSEIIRRFLGSD